MDLTIANQISGILQVKNPFATEQIAEGCNLWPKSLGDCMARADTFRLAKAATPHKAIPAFDELSDVIKGLDPLLREATPVEKEGYEQICFTGTPWSAANSIPFALLVLSFYKSYVVPGFGVLLPFLSIILPYIMLKTFYNIPITVTEYLAIVWRMWNGQKMPTAPEDFLNPPPEPPRDIVSQLKGYVQNGWTIFTFGQAMWQPIQQARHFMRLDADCLKLGELIVRVKGIGGGLVKDWGRWTPCWLSGWLAACPDGARESFAFCQEFPHWLRHTLRGLGRLEVLLRLAGRSDAVAAQFVGVAQGEPPVLMIKEFGDPSIAAERRVKSSLRLGGGSVEHSILTGPNRGGKSSFLRGVLMNVVLAHSFGAAFADKIQLTPFTWIANGLKLDDTPGAQSMFEREVAFGSAVAAKEGGRGLVLYDELFHSTNPPDAQRTSELFCDRLWAKKNCVSIVSTHVYSLARSAPEDRVKRLCVASWRGAGGEFKFSYKVANGVCEVSSVDLLLKQFGLL